MQVHIHSKNLSVRDNLKDYAEEKLGKLTKVYPEISSADIGFTRRAKKSGEDKYKVEITLHCKGNLVRAEEDENTPFAAIDLVSEKLERQLRRFKGKLYTNLNKHKKRSARKQRDSAGEFLTPEQIEALAAVGQQLTTPETNGAPMKDLEEPELIDDPADSDAIDDGQPVIVRSKSFAVKPMAPSEATMQMELLGHDFYVFLDDETNQVSVVYKRRDGNYGLIQPEIAQV